MASALLKSPFTGQVGQIKLTPRFARKGENTMKSPETRFGKTHFLAARVSAK
jgi:hypothetical protein